jgi:adenylate cyclase
MVARATRSIEAWLASEPARRLDDVALVTEFATRLSEVVPIGRFAISVRTMHPEVYVRNLVWTREGGTELFERKHEVLEQSMYRESPIIAIHSGTDRIRVRLDGSQELTYPVCRELRDHGATDYVVFRLPLYDEANSFASFVTYAEGGYSDEQLAELEALVDVLSLRVALASLRHAARSLLRTYLGREASRRVLGGSFIRGSGEIIDAVIWTCDMRGFTTLVDRHGMDEVIGLLDRYFESVASPIESNNGEILKLIGDAVLAVFPLSTCERAGQCALTAAREALAAAEKLITPGGEPLRIGVALHVGQVLYGNIGASRRLDFTVMGRAVNEVCRVEAKCKDLGVPLLLTDAFVRRMGVHAEADAIVSLGRHSLRGVAHEAELFTLASLAP